MVILTTRFNEKVNFSLFHVSIFSNKIDLIVVFKYFIKSTNFFEKKSTKNNFFSNINNIFPTEFNLSCFGKTDLNGIYVKKRAFLKTRNMLYKRMILNNIYFFMSIIVPFTKIFSLFLEKLQTIVFIFQKVIKFFILEKCEFQKKQNHFKHSLQTKYFIKFILEKNKRTNLHLFKSFSFKKKIKLKKKNLENSLIWNFGPCISKNYLKNRFFYRGFEYFHAFKKSDFEKFKLHFFEHDGNRNFFAEKQRNRKFCAHNFSLFKLWSLNHDILSIFNHRHFKKKSFSVIQPKNRFDIGISGKNFLLINNKTYLKLGIIGKGGSGKVYKIIRHDKKIFALKKSKIEGTGTQMINNFINEITILKFLSGKPRIIQIQDAEINFKKKLIFIILEFGEFDLEFLLQKKKKSFFHMISNGFGNRL